jgi:phage FluMu protein Com
MHPRHSRRKAEGRLRNIRKIFFGPRNKGLRCDKCNRLLAEVGIFGFATHTRVFCSECGEKLQDSTRVEGRHGDEMGLHNAFSSTGIEKAAPKFRNAKRNLPTAPGTLDFMLPSLRTPLENAKLSREPVEPLTQPRRRRAYRRLLPAEVFERARKLSQELLQERAL